MKRPIHQSKINHNPILGSINKSSSYRIRGLPKAPGMGGSSVFLEQNLFRPLNSFTPPKLFLTYFKLFKCIQKYRKKSVLLLSSHSPQIPPHTPLLQFLPFAVTPNHYDWLIDIKQFSLINLIHLIESKRIYKLSAFWQFLQTCLGKYLLKCLWLSYC